MRWGKRRRKGRRVFSKKQKKAIRSIARGDDNTYWANFDYNNIANMSNGKIGLRTIQNTYAEQRRDYQYAVDNATVDATKGFGFVNLPLADMELLDTDPAITSNNTALVTSNKIKLLGITTHLLFAAGSLKAAQENVPIRIIWGYHKGIPKEGWAASSPTNDDLPKAKDLYTTTKRATDQFDGISDVLYPWPKNRRDSTNGTQAYYKILGSKVIVVNSGPVAGKEDVGTREALVTIKFGRKIIEWERAEGSSLLAHAPGSRSGVDHETDYNPMGWGQPFIMAYVDDDRVADTETPNYLQYAATVKFEQRIYWQNLE